MLRLPPKRLWLPHPEFSVFLLVLWLLLMNSLAPIQILIGAVLGWVIPFSTQQFWPERSHMHHRWRLLPYLAHLLVDILKANWVVAGLLLRHPEHLRPAFIRYPLTVTDEFAITMLASSISLTPGTVATSLSPDRKVLLVHALHVRDEQALIDHIRTRYEQPLQEILE